MISQQFLQMISGCVLASHVVPKPTDKPATLASAFSVLHLMCYSHSGQSSYVLGCHTSQVLEISYWCCPLLRLSQLSAKQFKSILKCNHDFFVCETDVNKYRLVIGSRWKNGWQENTKMVLTVLPLLHKQHFRVLYVGDACA